MSQAPDFKTQRDVLISDITAAFGNVSREGGMSLHEAQAIDNRASLSEQKAARQRDIDRVWQNVSDKDIAACSSALSFLDTIGFCYYLPAFMVYSLKYWEDEPYIILDSCVFHLLHEPHKPLRQSEAKSIVMQYHFSIEQCAAIAKFLRFVIDHDICMADLPTIQAVEKWEEYVQEKGA